MSKYKRLSRTHANLQDIFSRSQRADNNCIEWQMSRTKSGYGQLRVGNKLLYVHRIVATIIYGEPSADANHVLHSCDNPSCVNPDHLRWGNPKDNSDDKIAKGRYKNGSLRGEQSPTSKLTEAQVREIRQKIAIKIPRKEIANEYGICIGHIKQIRSGKAWGWLE